MYIVSASGGLTCVIYLGLFKFKKDAMSLYNSAKQEIDEFASRIEGVAYEDTMNINKTSTSFSISYNCRKNNHFVLQLSIEYYTDRMFNDYIKNNMYTLKNGEQIPIYLQDEKRWREYFPDLFRGYSSQDLFDRM